MGRLIEHEAQGPRKLDPSDVDPEKGDVAICQCGLSAEYPFCDGSHRQTLDEEEGTCYRYESADGDLVRREVASIRFADGETEAVGDGGTG